MKKLKKYIKKNYKKIIHSIDIALLIIFVPSLFLFYWIGPWNTWLTIYILIALNLKLVYKYKYYRVYHSIFILILIILWSMGIHQSNIRTVKTIQPCTFLYSSSTTGSASLGNLGTRGGSDKLKYYYLFATWYTPEELQEIKRCELEPYISR